MDMLALTWVMLVEASSWTTSKATETGVLRSLSKYKKLFDMRYSQLSS